MIMPERVHCLGRLQRRGVLIDVFKLPSGARVYFPIVAAWDNHERARRARGAADNDDRPGH